ncbi:MAG: hyalin [Microcystis wesenbergii Mw_QC_S_20081001_S30]|nr:MAG: hyalin [Microcystis wesenbergii Mw_QC_S_20081001_S30]
MSTPFLVKDILPGFYGSSPSYLTAVGNTLFFWANDGVNGYGLWKSDGTTAGTVLVADISFGDSFPGNLTAVGNTLYFQAYDGVNGGELWKSDGTAAGTVLVKDIRPGLSTSYPVSLTAVGNTLFFAADDGVNGFELWKSDGTAAGTVLVKNINPGSGFSGNYPRNLTVVGNTLFFTADDGVNGIELWKSDGTEAGTVLVGDIRPGSSSSDPQNLRVVGSTLYFTADDGVNGGELWQSDGTAAGTVLVKDIRPGSYGSYPFSLTAVGNTLFFTANDGVNGWELWALNVGTPAIPTLAIAATSANQTEGNSGSKAFTFTVTRADNTTGSNNVNWAVTGSGSNPANATDFVGGVLPSGSVSFATGETSKVITVDVQGDTTVELNENFTVTLSNATNGATITTATATGTIQNDDVAVPTLTIAATSASQTEGNSGSKAFTFTVTRGDNTTGSNNVDWAVTGSGSNPANATDFAGGLLPSGVVSFAPGESSKVITVDVQGDTTVELNENFTVTLSNPTNGATITTATATGTINNDDFIGTSGPDTLVGTSGADAMTGLAGNDTYTVNDAGDLVIEALNQGTDTVQASIFYTLPNNVENLLLTGTGNLNGTGNGLNNQITGNSGNNNLNGAAGNDSLNGAAGNDTLNGAAGRDTLTGGTGTDIFIFRFGQSTAAARDRVTDFAIGTDKIDLLSQAGAAINAPLAFTRATDSTTTNINTIVANVFTDANGATAGNQALGTNSAVLVRVANTTTTYLIINDGTAGFQSANDLVINLTGLTGTLPALGTIAVNSFFV